MKFVRLFIMVLIISLLLPACSTQKGEDRYTGILADEDIVSSIKQEIADKENSLLANENDVFWSESGKLWHKSTFSLCFFGFEEKE